MTLLTNRVPAVPWRIAAWIAMTVLTVVNAHGVGIRVVTAALMVSSWLALQLVAEDRPLGEWAVAFAAVTGLATCAVAPNGAAPVLVCVAAARAPSVLAGRWLRTFVILGAAGFGVTVALVTHSIFGLLAALAVPTLAQRTVEHRELVQERDRAQALLAEAQQGREAEARAAALQERGRIAREMHDVLAHSLAGLSVQLQAVRAIAAREQAGPALLAPLDKAAALAREGLGEARAAVSTLRDPAGLGLAELPALVERHPGEATLRTAGDPAEVSAEAGHAVYRAVQEALTNVARHAPGARATVHLTWSDRELEARVSDSGRMPGRTAVAGAGTGLGLSGMAERLVTVGGRVEAGPDGAGWTVRITVPANREGA